MKFFIAFTFFAVVSALPWPRIEEDKTSHIVFRHWEPTPENDVRRIPDSRTRPHLPNVDVNNLIYIKELISQLLKSTDVSDDPNGLLNALTIIKGVLNNIGSDLGDDDAGLPIFGGIDVEPDGDNEVDSSIYGEPDNVNGADSANNNESDNGSDLPVNGRADNGQEDEIYPENELVGERRLVDFMPRPVPSPKTEGIALVDSPIGGVDEPDQI